MEIVVTFFKLYSSYSIMRALAVLLTARTALVIAKSLGAYRERLLKQQYLHGNLFVQGNFSPRGDPRAGENGPYSEPARMSMTKRRTAASIAESATKE